MDWVLAALTLVVVGYVCRRILRLDEPPSRPRALTTLPTELDSIYRPVYLELETQIVLLGISLNEALGERESGNEENARHLVRLAVCQWDRLADIAGGLLNTIADYFPQARSLSSFRELDADQFRSRAMIEFMRKGALVHQVIFRSKSRHLSRLRIARRAIETLTAEFRGAFQAASHTPDAPDEVWNSIDPSFHDFDLVIKQALLAFRAILPALPASVLPLLASEISAIMDHSVRRSKSAVTSKRD